MFRSDCANELKSDRRFNRFARFTVRRWCKFGWCWGLLGATPADAIAAWVIAIMGIQGKVFQSECPFSG
ncbi:MAG: hypothetical protein ACTS2F_29975 [Thainema sp.]